jgi:hypothetical protein
MMALEIISTVKRVANPSAVRKTRKARMTQLKGQNSRAAARPRTMCPYADAADSLLKKT